MSITKLGQTLLLRSLAQSRVIAVVCIALLDGTASAAEKITGRATFSMTHLVTIPVGVSSAEHTLLHTMDQASQFDLSSDLFADCSIERTTTCDMVHGRGTCFGYQTLISSDGDRLVTKYSGIIQPDSGVDKKPPDLIVHGTWVVINGSGKFANVHGGGTYRGRYTSTQQYALEWSGEIEQRPRANATAPPSRER